MTGVVRALTRAKLELLRILLSFYSSPHRWSTPRSRATAAGRGACCVG